MFSRCITDCVGDTFFYSASVCIELAGHIFIINRIKLPLFLLTDIIGFLLLIAFTNIMWTRPSPLEQVSIYSIHTKMIQMSYELPHGCRIYAYYMKKQQRMTCSEKKLQIHRWTKRDRDLSLIFSKLSQATRCILASTSNIMKKTCPLNNHMIIMQMLPSPKS